MRFHRLLILGLTLGACAPPADSTIRGTLLDGSEPSGDGAVVSGTADLGAAGDAGSTATDAGVAGPVHTIKLSQSLYCPRMSSITAQLFFADQAAVTTTYDTWLAGAKSGGGSYVAPPLDVLGTRVRTGEQGGGSALTPTQLENQKIACIRLNATAGPGAFETTTLTPDPSGKPVCLLNGMDWGIDFHYGGATFPMRAVCSGAPTTFAWTTHFDNDSFPTILGTNAYAVGDRTYLLGSSTGIWAGSPPAGQAATKGTVYNMALTATNGTGGFTTPQFKYRFVHIGDVINGGMGGIARHPSDSKCMIKSLGDQAGNNMEGQVAYPSGNAWAMRVMLVAKAGGPPNQFQWILWGDSEFAIGQSVQPYAVISDLPCEFDQIVDGCYSDSVVISYYPGSPVYMTDKAAAKAQGRRYCGMRPGQIYYMNVRSKGWLNATPADSCPAGQTCTFGAFLNQQ